MHHASTPACSSVRAAFRQPVTHTPPPARPLRALRRGGVGAEAPRPALRSLRQRQPRPCAPRPRPFGVRPHPAPLSPGSPQRCPPPGLPSRSRPAPPRPAPAAAAAAAVGARRLLPALRCGLAAITAQPGGSSGQGRAGPRHGARLSGEAAAAAPGPGMGGSEEAARRRRRRRCGR